MPKKGTKQSKKVQKIEISDDEMSDNDSVASEPVDSDSESETEIELKSSKKTKSSSKAKKTKKSDEDEEQSKVESSFQELHDKFESFSEFTNSLKKLSDELTSSIKSFKSLEKDVKKVFKQVQLEVGKEHKKLSKGKRKVSGDRKKGGVTKLTPVPSKIIKYLKLDDDAKFSRPEITAKLYQEFKERELSIGNCKNKMDKDTAKLFGGKSGDEFHIYDFQKMLKKIYDSDPKTKKTSKKSQDSDGEEEEDL